MDLPAIIAQQLAGALPANVPAHMRPNAGYVTRRINGKWVIVPVNGGNADPALRPRITVTPLGGGKAKRLPYRGR